MPVYSVYHSAILNKLFHLFGLFEGSFFYFERLILHLVLLLTLKSQKTDEATEKN